jgi:protein TonB
MEESMFKAQYGVVSLAFLAVTSLAAAAEVPASFDVKSCKVDYPKSSLLNEEQGVTTMSFLVSPSGSVVEAKLEKTSGFKNLDKAALTALSACKFKPGTRDGKPDQTWTKVDYHWHI